MKLLLLVIFSLWTPVDHDIHLSVIEVEISEGKGSLVSKIFLDDLQQSMGLVPGEELPEDYQGAEDLVQRFMDKSLLLKINNNPVKITLSYIEPALPAVWATFTIESIAVQELKEVTVENKIMIDLFEDQKNIFKVNIEGVKEEHVFSVDDNVKTFEF